MAVFFFTVSFFLFLLLSGTLCGHLRAKSETSLTSVADIVKEVKLFKKEEITVELNPKGEKCKEGETLKINVKDYYSLFFVTTNDVFVALVGVNSVDNSKENITVLTRYIVTKDDNNWKEKVVSDTVNNNWKTQLAVETKIDKNDDSSILKSFFAATKNNKIYLLLVICSNKNSGEDTSKTNCNFEVVVGAVNDNGEPNKKKILWKNQELPPKDNNYKFTSEITNVLECNYPIFGNSFLKNKDKIIFVLKAKVKQTNKNITLLIGQKEEKENEFELLSVKNLSDDCHPYFFSWNKKIIMLTPDCKNEGKTNIKESTDIKNEWSESKGSLFRLADFLKDKYDFITANTNDNKEFIIFTQEIKTEGSLNNEKRYLWVSDGTRAKQVGEITTYSKCTSPTGIFFLNGELFLFTQKCNTEEIENVCLTHLIDYTTKIKNVLEAWKNNENKVQQLCTNNINTKKYCSTNGLIGFLSDKLSGSDNKEWKDDYMYRDATVKQGGKNTQNGITFEGKGAGAEWLIGEKKDEQPYNFTDSGFTFLATVTIQEVTAGNKNSILGINFVKDKKTIGLWCSDNAKWIVGEGEEKSTSEDCKNGNTYQVMFILQQSGKFTVYINGNQLDNLSEEIMQIAKTESISYFYFGADKDKSTVNTHVTIGNVFLYNRPFDSSEITKLKVVKEDQTSDDKKENIESSTLEQQSSSSDSSELTEKSVKDGEGEVTTATLTGDVVQSSTQQRESAARVNVNVCVCNVLYLLLLILILVEYYV